MHRPQFRCRLTTADSLVAEPYAIAFSVSETSPRAVTSRADLSGAERTTIKLDPAASPSVARSNEPALAPPLLQIAGSPSVASRCRRRIEGRTEPEAQRKMREDYDYIFHDEERYRRAAREAEAAQQGGKA